MMFALRDVPQDDSDTLSCGESGYYSPSSGPIDKAHHLLARKPLSFAEWAKQADWSKVL